MLKAIVDVKALEEKVFLDIATVRRSFALLELFLEPLYAKCDRHTKNRDSILTYSIWAAALDSIIGALGRLLQASPKGKECTLGRYINSSYKAMGNVSIKSHRSKYSEECIAKLKDKAFLRKTKKLQEQYRNQIMPWRNKILAHSELGIEYTDLSDLRGIANMIDFVEDVHRTCHSAIDDASIPTKYISEFFQKISTEWIDSISSRGKTPTIGVSLFTKEVKNK